MQSIRNNINNSYDNEKMEPNNYEADKLGKIIKGHEKAMGWDEIEPVGKFIMDQKGMTQIVTGNGYYWHYKDVVTLMTRYAESKQSAMVKVPDNAHDQIIANQVAGMPLEEAIYQAGYTAGVEFQKGRMTQADDWISVDERLPYRDGDSSIYCIVYDVYWGVVVRPFNEAHTCWDGEDGDDYYTDAKGGKITHWKPCPDSPFKK